MRNIRVISSQADNVKTISSSATTWGKLKQELGSHFSGVSDMKAIVRDTRITLESDEAILPTGDFTIILSMKKIASGIDIYEETGFTKEELEDLKMNLISFIDTVLELDTSANNDEDSKALDELSAEGLI